MAEAYPDDPWARAMREAYEGERTFDTGGAVSQREQLAALSEGFGEDSEANQRVMAENYEQMTGQQYGQITGETLDPIDMLPDADLDAVLSGDIDAVSEAGLDILLQLPDEQFNQLFPQEVSAPAADVDMTDPINQLVEGVGGQVSAVPPELDLPERQYTPGEKFAAGGAFEVGQLGRGLSQLYYQLAGSEQEVAAIEAMEKKAREAYAKIDDQGFGPEDVGEAALAFGTLLIPGANGVRAAAAGTKALQTLARTSSALGTAGANAAMIGAVEAAKATVDDESRLAKGATAAAVGAGTAFGLNKLGGMAKSLFTDGFIGKSLAAVGIGKAMGASRSAVRDGVFRRFYGTILNPRRGSSVDPALAAKKVATSPQTQAMRSAAMKAELKAAEQTGNAPQVWATFRDVMEGPVNDKGRRTGGFVSVRANKWAKENGFDSKAEAQRIATFLSQKARMRGDRGELMFDRQAVLEAYETIATQPQFQAAYGKTKAGKELAKFMNELQAGQGPISARGILESYEARQRDAARETLKNLTPEKVEVFEKAMADIKSRTLAVLAAETDAQEGEVWDTFNQAYEAMTDLVARQ